MKNKLKDIIRKSIDIHVHIGPEAIPRKYTVADLIQAEQGKIAGCVLKNHFYPTIPFIKEVRSKKDLLLFGSVTLNNAVGGLNPEAIYASSLIADKPIIIWFPTINAENFLSQSEFEIAPEWVKKKDFKARRAKEVRPVAVTKNGKLTDQAVSILRATKKCKAVLATGHISWKESVTLVEEAVRIGVKQIVVTHPIYQRIAMPVDVQETLAKRGCFMEQSYSMYSIDKIPIAEIAKQIEEVGIKSVILSSDVGQTFSPSPSEAMLRFGKLLSNQGISEDELFIMMVKNPRTLLGVK